MQVEYCEGCKKRLTEHDVAVGTAVWVGPVLYCLKCAEKSGNEYMVVLPVKTVNTVGSAKTSGIRQALSAPDPKRPGSVIRKGSNVMPIVRPPSNQVRPISNARKTPNLRSSGTLNAVTGPRASGRNPSVSPRSGQHDAARLQTPDQGTGVFGSAKAKPLHKRHKRSQDSEWMPIMIGLIVLAAGLLALILLLKK